MGAAARVVQTRPRPAHQIRLGAEVPHATSATAVVAGGVSIKHVSADAAVRPAFPRTVLQTHTNAMEPHAIAATAMVVGGVSIKHVSADAAETTAPRATPALTYSLELEHVRSRLSLKPASTSLQTAQPCAILRTSGVYRILM